MTKPATALTIAGFDPSGGAGVLADIRTFADFGLQAAAAITSITFQNSAGVVGAAHQSGEVVRAQVEPLLEDFRIACVKTGILPTREVVSEVARLFRETELPRPVVDPVFWSTSGHRLMEEDALEVLVSELIPLARLITPNISEAETLTATKITSEVDMRRAAAVIRKMGASAVLIKGGHLRRQKAAGRRQEAENIARDESDEAIDVLDNDGQVTMFSERRIIGAELHGSGCILSAAIAAGLGNGLSLEEAVGEAKSFVLKAIRKAAASGGSEFNR